VSQTRTPLHSTDRRSGELCQRIQADGDRDAMAELVSLHVGLVTSIVKRFCRDWDGAIHEDLHSEGVIGLMTAAQSYDPNRTAFATYATHCVRRNVQEAWHNRLLVYVPRWAWSNTVRGKSVVESVRRDVFRAHTAIPKGHTSSEYDAPTGVQHDGELDSLADTSHNPHDHVEEIEYRSSIIDACLSAIPADDRDLIERRYGLNGYTPHTLQQLGGVLGVSKEYTRQREAAALERARKAMRRAIA
jgi:RNA polymerase sigma factor (sigma-70 family)